VTQTDKDKTNRERFSRNTTVQCISNKNMQKANKKKFRLNFNFFKSMNYAGFIFDDYFIIDKR